MKSKVIVLVIVVFGLLAVGFGGFIVYDKVLNKNLKSSVNNDYNEKSLTKAEALKEGQRLYDKATEIYETWLLRPYCGVKLDAIDHNQMEKLGDSNLGNGEYYKSEFSSLDDLKTHLKNWLSDDIVDTKVVKTNNKYVEDVSLLSNNEKYSYVDYVLKDNKLYCRAQVGQGYLSYYHSYKIKVDNIERNKIIYTITSAYMKNNIDDSSTSCNLDNLKACSEKDLEYKDTKFVIQKNKSSKFVVSEFTLHD